MHCPSENIPFVLCMSAKNNVSLVFHTTCEAFYADVPPISLPSYTSLCAVTITSILDLFYAALWFNPREVQRFSDTGNADGNGILPGPLTSGHIQYFE